MFACSRAHDTNLAWTNSDICVQSYLRVCGFACLRVLYFLFLCLDLGWVIFMNISIDFIISKAWGHIYVWISITHHMLRPYILAIDIFGITVVIWARVINNFARLWRGDGVDRRVRSFLYNYNPSYVSPPVSFQSVYLEPLS